MSEFTRYAIYYVPRPGPLADFGANWLGWDVETGTARPRADTFGLEPETLDDLTQKPRKYGFHGTLKAPFRLNDDQQPGQLIAALDQVAASLAPTKTAPLKLNRIDGFLALTPRGEQRKSNAIAAACVEELDRFRARPTAEETARYDAAALTPTQQDMLSQWGYPYAMNAFNFHLTLTRSQDAVDAQDLRYYLAPVVDHLVHKPFDLDALTLVGEMTSGQFKVIHRAALKG
jgi:hypothetical protein